METISIEENQEKKLKLNNYINDKYLNALLYKQDNNDATKQRPYLCVTAFPNNAGVLYNYLLIPITSVKTVGDKNLVSITHRKLKKDSYCKLNNMFTVNANEMCMYECVREKFEEKVVKKVLNSLKKLLITKK